MILINTVLIYAVPVREFSTTVALGGKSVVMSALDLAASVILLVLILIYVVTVIKDARDYDKIDPMP